MLAEIAVYIASLPRAPAPYRRHLSDAIGLWARGQRQREAWAPHREATKAVIVEAMSKLPSHRTAAILGSGPLFDVPIEAISARFERVLLLDIAHLATISQRLASLANVERAWRDLSPPGQAEPLAFLSDIPELDWVVSVNLLSQLARAARDGTERATIDRHLDGLSKMPVTVTLVTDTAYRVLDRAGRELEAFDLLYGRTLPRPASKWNWEVAPFGEESPRSQRIHTVFAYPEWPKAEDLVLPRSSSRVRRADPVAQQDRAQDS